MPARVRKRVRYYRISFTLSPLFCNARSHGILPHILFLLNFNSRLYILIHRILTRQSLSLVPYSKRRSALLPVYLFIFFQAHHSSQPDRTTEVELPELSFGYSGLVLVTPALVLTDSINVRLIYTVLKCLHPSGPSQYLVQSKSVHIYTDCLYDSLLQPPINQQIYKKAR